jgi:phospholipid/cholesterol/gamma-HCH transport system permease protein
LASAPQLTATVAGDALELRAGGSWTAANVVTLEALSGAVTAQIDRSKTVRMDMTGVSQLDTLGAWILEKISRRATSAGRRANVIGIADNYAGLIQEVHQVNRYNPVPPPGPNPVQLKVSDVGRSAVGAAEDLTVFLQMLGSFFLPSLEYCAGRDRCG